MQGFGRISLIFGQECKSGLVVGGSILSFNRDLVRSGAALSKGVQPQMRTRAFFEALSDVKHRALHAVLDRLSVLPQEDPSQGRLNCVEPCSETKPNR